MLMLAKTFQVSSHVTHMPHLKSGPVIPLYHPTSVLLVDDNEAFLRSLKLVLQDGFECFAFTDAAGAIAFLRSEAELLSTLTPSPTDDESPLMEHIRDPLQRELHIRVSQLPRLFADKRRFSRPSIVVADHAMPGLNGLDMLETLRDLPQRKVLLSGTVDESRAHAAVASGLIDAYQPKQHPDLHDSLIVRLKALQFDYFGAVTRPLEPALTGADTRFLQDDAFVHAFARFIKDHRIVEHCVLMQPPGILGLDERGAPTILLVADDDYRQASFEIAQAEEAPVGLLRRLAFPSTLAVFPTVTGFYSREIGENWSPFLWQSTRLGRAGLQTAVISDADVVRHVCGSVSSYAEYRLRRIN